MNIKTFAIAIYSALMKRDEAGTYKRFTEYSTRRQHVFMFKLTGHCTWNELRLNGVRSDATVLSECRASCRGSCNTRKNRATDDISIIGH